IRKVISDGHGWLDLDGPIVIQSQDITIKGNSLPPDLAAAGIYAYHDPTKSARVTIGWTNALSKSPGGWVIIDCAFDSLIKKMVAADLVYQDSNDQLTGVSRIAENDGVSDDVFATFDHDPVRKFVRKPGGAYEQNMGKIIPYMGTTINQAFRIQE